MSTAMSNSVDCGTEQAGAYPVVVRTRAHTFRADVDAESGSTDSAPSPHDYFDAALASCKALTTMWYAKRHGIPLERIESHVERDDSEERSGHYRLRVRLVFYGPLTDAQRKTLGQVADKCPLHKLMTSTQVEIATEA